MTIYQTAALRVNDETAIGAGEGEFIDTLVKAGYARVELLLNARREGLAQVPRSYVDKVKARGAKAWGVIWADSFATPGACFDFLLAERSRLGLSGFVLNAEDGIEARDQAGDKWSERFLTYYRGNPSTAKLALCLDTYIGCGGLALRKWQDHGARLIVQTHHEASQLEWGVYACMLWAQEYGWTKPSMIKPEFCCYKSGGQLPDAGLQAAMIGGAQGRTKGLVMYYAEGAGDPSDYLIPFLLKAKSAGICA